MHRPSAREHLASWLAIVRQTGTPIRIRIAAMIVQIERTQPSITAIIPIAATIREPC